MTAQRREYDKQEAELQARIGETQAQLENLESELQHRKRQTELDGRAHKEQMDDERQRLELDMRVIDKRQKETHESEQKLSQERDDFLRLKDETLKLQKQAQGRLQEVEIKEANMSMQKEETALTRKQYEEQLKRLNDEQQAMQQMWQQLRHQKDNIAQQQASLAAGGNVDMGSFKQLQAERDQLIRELDSCSAVRYTFLGFDLKVKTPHAITEGESYKVREVDAGYDKPTEIVFAESEGDRLDDDTETCLSSNMETMLSGTDNGTYPAETPLTNASKPTPSIGFHPMDLSEKYQSEPVRNEY